LPEFLGRWPYRRYELGVSQSPQESLDNPVLTTMEANHDESPVWPEELPSVTESRDQGTVLVIGQDPERLKDGRQMLGIVRAERTDQLRSGVERSTIDELLRNRPRTPDIAQLAQYNGKFLFRCPADELGG